MSQRTTTPHAPPRRHVLGAGLDELARYFADQGQPAYRARQVLDWVYGRGGGEFQQMTNLSKLLRHRLTQDWVVRTATEARRRTSVDGTVKLLLAWPDGATSECVLICEGRRRTACLSSQVGCPVRCAFCASGLNGLQRQLTAGEIVEQAHRLRALCEERSVETGGEADGPAGPARLSHIVLMGLGEPLANYEPVMKAVRTIHADWGMNIGARHITLSTVGVVGRIRRLAGEGLPINLAISLHAPNDDLRRRLIPWARRVSIAELVAAGREYFDRTGREVTVEYILLAEVNDQPEQANELVKVCRAMRCNVNLIRYNPVPGLPFERPSSFAAQRFLARLRSRGVNAHLRKSRGLDITAACGQLRRTSASTPDCS